MSSTSEQNKALQAARNAAEISRQYSSDKTRSDLVTTFKRAFKDLEPYSWQLDVAEALLLGLDCITIAGTGSGKTMQFAMPLLVDRSKKKRVIVISPLNDLEEDQARLFRLSWNFLLKTITLGSQVSEYWIDSSRCEWRGMERCVTQGVFIILSICINRLICA